MTDSDRPCAAEPQLRDHEDQFGRTPLMYCVLADRLDCAEVLLKAGASVSKTDHSQRSALHLAAQKVQMLTDAQRRTLNPSLFPHPIYSLSVLLQ